MHQVPKGDGSSQISVRSVLRAIDLLIALTVGPKPLHVISAEVGLSKATAHRLLATMATKFMVVQDPASSDYLLGPACFRLVEATVGRAGALGVALTDELGSLVQESSETVAVHVRFGASRICIQELVSRQPIHYSSGIGEIFPLHVGSSGKVLLAFLPDETRSALIAQLRLEKLTDRTTTDRESLDEELRAITRRGWSFSRGERIVGATAVTAPILNELGHAVAALSVLGPDERLSTERIEQLSKVVCRSAKDISFRLFGGEFAGDDCEK